MVLRRLRLRPPFIARPLSTISIQANEDIPWSWEDEISRREEEAAVSVSTRSLFYFFNGPHFSWI